jgi:hypothetical protein
MDIRQAITHIYEQNQVYIQLVPRKNGVRVQYIYQNKIQYECLLRDVLGAYIYLYGGYLYSGI